MVREGRDLTIVSWSAQVIGCANAAEALAAKGIDAEVIDLRTLWPWDKARVRRERRKDRAAARGAGVGLGRRLRGGGRGDSRGTPAQGAESPGAPPRRAARADLLRAAARGCGAGERGDDRCGGGGAGSDPCPPKALLVVPQRSGAKGGPGPHAGSAGPVGSAGLDLCAHAGMKAKTEQTMSDERDDRRRGAGPDARGPQGRADVRHGRVPAACRSMTPRAGWSSTHHLINDERCGVFAADAYAKVSGRVGLVDATLGPRRHEPRHRARRGAQRRHADGGASSATATACMPGRT